MVPLRSPRPLICLDTLWAKKFYIFKLTSFSFVYLQINKSRGKVKRCRSRFTHWQNQIYWSQHVMQLGKVCYGRIALVLESTHVIIYSRKIKHFFRSCSVDSGFDSESSRTDDLKICICSFPAGQCGARWLVRLFSC